MNNINDFIHLNIKNFSNEIEEAKNTAYKKTNFTFNSWKNRTEIERFINIFWGDFAKNIIKSLIKEFFIKNNLDYNKFLLEYDAIRTDDFKKSDLYDLYIINNNKKLEIEIKSSIEKYTEKPQDLLHRRIIFNLNNSHEHISDLLIQIFFVNKNLDLLSQEFIKTNKNIFNENIINNYLEKVKELNIEIYFVGYITKKEQVEYKNK